MNYSGIYECDIANGPGCRVVLFVSGCTKNCYNCQNPETHDFNYGKPFTKETRDKLIELVRPDHISGLTISGGDPLEPANRHEVAELIKTFRKAYKDTKTIWLYTGNIINDKFNISSAEELDVDYNVIFHNVDVIVDGPYIDDLRDLTLKWRGSSNQRVIDVHKTTGRNIITLVEGT